MKKYLTSAAVGLAIASIIMCIAILLMNSSYTKMIIVTLVQGMLQGLAATAIYWRRHLPYLVRMILQAIVSYLLALGMLLFNQEIWQVNIGWFSIQWFVIWLILFLYFNHANQRQAEKVNQKLSERKKEKSDETY
ncbi:MAG: DUF3021 domain-containing protein [Streptococcaceae bacterium]|nr:DUF3021 domain-containing protein [Streptococcaceae bacterium]